MQRYLLSSLCLVGLLGGASASADDYQRGRAVERGEARVSGERYDRQAVRGHDERRSEPRREAGGYWNRQPEHMWQRDERVAREQGRNYIVDTPKHPRYDDRRWRNDERWRDQRGLPHSDPRYRDYRGDRYRDHRSDWHDPKWRRNWHHGWSGYRYRAPIRYYYPQGYSRYHWRVGYTLPTPFLISSWYVDYRPYGIAPPPHGCRWVRVDGDLLLVELATGFIVDVLYDFYY